MAELRDEGSVNTSGKGAGTVLVYTRKWWKINSVHQKTVHCHGRMAQFLAHALLSAPI